MSFAQSSPFLSYTAEPKGDTLSSHKTCYFGEPPKFQFFWVMDNMKWPVVKGKFRKRTLEAAHLIPMMSNQNWYMGDFLESFVWSWTIPKTISEIITSFLSLTISF
jgi:hypothetical protein